MEETALSTTTAPSGGPAVRLWRHHDPVAADLPGIDLGTEQVTGDLVDAAAGLVARGTRRAALSAPVDLSGAGDPAATVRALVLVRELTSHAVAVDWRLLAAPGEQWRLLGHLYPPSEVAGPSGQDILAEWRSGFHLCRFVYRRGPGFVQVRDRRFGDLSCFTIDDPAYLAAIAGLRTGATASTVPGHVMDDLLAEGLVGVVGELAWWIPYQARHWPWPVMTI